MDAIENYTCVYMCISDFTNQTTHAKGQVRLREKQMEKLQLAVTRKLEKENSLKDKGQD